MPLTTDETTLATANEVISLLKGTAGGPHPGWRPAHAKGQLLTGTFTPTAEAAALSKAPHFCAASTPVTVRFSDAAGLPVIPDTSPRANPKGIALRFHLPDSADGKRVHTDIVGHSSPFFPTQTGADFAAFIKAAGASQDPNLPHPTPIEQFLGTHPAALAFATSPKPFPVSFATEKFFALSAFKFIAANGKETFIRYRFEPVAGHQTIPDAEIANYSDNYLFEEVAERVKAGKIVFKLLAQIAEEGDQTDDITVHWPEDRKLVELGTFELDKLVEDNEVKQKYAIFDPVPRLDGIEPSKDPILEFRAAVYLISGKERRAA